MKQIRFGTRIDNSLKQRRLKTIFKKLVPITIVLGLLIALAIFLTTLSGPSVINFIISGTSLNSDDGRVNILLLGMAGGTHDGATLTDTILVASYNLKSRKLHLISIPRDLWLPSLQIKANAAYQVGLTQKNGLIFSKTVMGNVIGLPIHYGLRVDFNGFVKIVDALGKIDVEVEREFDDYNYPITGKENDLCGFEEKEIDFSDEEAQKLHIQPGKREVFIAPDGKIATDSAEEDKGTKYFTCRYEHIHFNKGETSMGGDTALKFVRSRHGTNGENSDFARSARQGKVLQAIRNKVLSLETLTDPQKIGDLIQILGKSIDTDIAIKDIAELYKFSKNLGKTYSIVLDDSILFHPSSADYGGSYVLISQDDDFSIIHEYINKVFLEDEKDEATSSARPR
ncbi:LCP family protein [Candidatus Daviesbacteria bacterium]|nr:LCP family protein [Candidatus Daviesbacteria bacterium]